MLPTFRSSRRSWDAMIDASECRFVRVDVPYDGTELPGYLLRPDADGVPRPTFVMTNGSDGSLAALWSSGAAEALARGWNAFVYDGPGQQSMLFERGVPFRPDWEAVLTPVVDTLVDRPDVDASALIAYGISQAGYWLPRTLAFEHRFVAAVAHPGVVDVSTSWMDHLPPEMTALLDSGQKDMFNGLMAQMGDDPDLERTFAFRARPYGIDDPFDLFTAMRTYQLRDVAGQIRTPLLITDPDDEQFWPGQGDAGGADRPPWRTAPEVGRQRWDVDPPERTGRSAEGDDDGGADQRGPGDRDGVAQDRSWFAQKRS